MAAAEPFKPASRWEFTPVYEILKRPIEVDIPEPLHNPAVPSRPSHTESPVSLLPHQKEQDEASSSNLQPEAKQNYRKLGDFGALWDLIALNNTHLADTTAQNSPGSCSAKLNDSLPCSRPALLQKQNPPVDGSPGCFINSSSSLDCPVSPSRPIPTQKPHMRSTHPPSPVTILKRDSSNTTGLNCTAQATAQKPSTPVTKAELSLATPKSKTKSRRKARAKPNGTAESSADAESDSSNIVPGRRTTNPGGLPFIPSQVLAKDNRQDYESTLPSSYDDQDTLVNSGAVKPEGIISTPRHTQIIPLVYKNTHERRVFLMTKLLIDFPEYAQLVSQVGRLPSFGDSQLSRPIHVFVDMSNILVGFHNAAKASRGLDTTVRVRRLHMSFANLSLIMERGRQATKRVLVGSDRVPSVDEAEHLGYEVNILDRVSKMKTTPRSPHPRNLDVQNSHLCWSETAGQRERWVEQGVDEILHLKILETLLDTEKPATIVLASGDAAKAEYSGGFLTMVERALQRGWNVELVSFSQLTSFAYKKKEFRAKMGHPLSHD
ncbi:hypothetical protein N7468_005032 [Penicillium chermesinum]|uniref:NYN domain-containing protein n=1 Tax=Penicillium chermesinum TaxID=63820 RepID=A0A9W9NYR4_9EURO|nr:uncharacterized protein N7468_005032 [Penicillium chermesinum]KAJ5232076.1 hypothetical protein N7468_005032 [Penicillium chermesinum]